MKTKRVKTKKRMMTRMAMMRVRREKKKKKEKKRKKRRRVLGHISKKKSESQRTSPHTNDDTWGLLQHWSRQCARQSSALQQRWCLHQDTTTLSEHWGWLFFLSVFFPFLFPFFSDFESTCVCEGRRTE